MTVVAAFDVDGTLTTRDSVVPFLAQFARRPAAVARTLRELPAATRALLTRDRDRLREAATRAVLTGVPAARLDAAGTRFGELIVAERLRTDTTARLRWHVAEGHRVVLVSASYEAYLHALGRSLGADAVLATRVEVRGGTCTGRLVGANCRAEEKVRRLHAWLSEQGLGRTDVTLWAYGDSAGDQALLADADHPVWVKEPLATIAAS